MPYTNILLVLFLHLLTAGCTYDGEWRDGMQHGEGTYRWANGNVYVGQWEKNKFHGQGECVFCDIVCH